MTSRSLVPALLVPCVLAFFWPLVLNPAAVLYAPRSDFIAQHLPAKLFLVDALHETGERPLWCPYRFCGDSFVGDSQVAAFYPPHLLLSLVPRDHVGAYLSWLVLLHVLAAGLSAYAYARHEGLGPAGSFVSGAGYMFAGKWLLHLLAGGHYIVIGLAWLPLVLLCLEKALRQRSLGWATAAGAAFAMIALSTHPQWLVYAAVMSAAWTLPTALERVCSLRAGLLALCGWLRFGLWAATVVVGLCAVQLLPTREAAKLSSRGRERTTAFFRDDGISSVRNLIGPSPSDVSWEDVYGVGLTWAMAAAAAAASARFLPGRPRLYTWAVLCIALFAICRGGPAQVSPVLRLFRCHFRAFVLVALPLALLAGTLTDRLAGSLVPSLLLRRRVAVWAAGVGLACLLGAAWHAHEASDPLVRHLYWFTLPVTGPVLVWLAWSPAPWRTGWGVWAWCGLLVADVFTLVCPQVEVRRQDELYRPSPCVSYLAERRETHGRILDLLEYEQQFLSPLGNGAPLAMTQGLEAVRGYNPMDAAHFRDFISLIADNTRPEFHGEVIMDMPEVNPGLVQLLGVRFRLQSDDTPLPKGHWRPVFRDETPVPAYHYQFGDFPPLPPYTVYENEHALPRAFVVPVALKAPAARELLHTLKFMDFRQAVLLDHYHPTNTQAPAGAFRPSRIVGYRPNRVTLDVESEGSGWLVLTDVWYPGWHATVDGRDAQLFRANGAFRAVAVPGGRHEVVFRFDPASYRIGCAVSMASLGVVALIGLAAAWRKLQRNPGGVSRPAMQALPAAA